MNKITRNLISKSDYLLGGLVDKIKHLSSLAKRNNPKVYRDLADYLIPQKKETMPERLNAQQWTDVLISTETRAKIINRLQTGTHSDWCTDLMQYTSKGDKVLEIGSGSGEMSLALALNGCDVTLLDNSNKNLDFASSIASELGIKVQCVYADATKPLPFEDGSFDVVWSSGLLEHFSFAERNLLLNNWSKCSCDYVINFVPNASSIAYRTGKWLQEQRGEWKYGYELPIKTLLPEYLAAKLDVLAEYSIAPMHSLNFLPYDSFLYYSLQQLFVSLDEEVLSDFNQGYLLATIGKVRL